MRDDIYCLMTAGVSLTDEMRTFLYRVACEMYRKGQERRVVKFPHDEAIIRTKYKTVGVGWIFGLEFFADVETDTGKGQIKYVVRDGDLDKILAEGVWVQLDPEPKPDQKATAWLN